MLELYSGDCCATLSLIQSTELHSLKRQVEYMV